MIDLHSHILPGLDDGARTLADSLEMAQAALADGIRLIAATPHVRFDYPTTVDQMERGVAELCRALDRAGLELDVRRGGEIDLEALESLSDDEIERFALGGGAGYLLVEFPYRGWPAALPGTVLGLASRGVTAVIAHPERNSSVQDDPDRLRPTVLAGALVQLTAASVDGRLGRRSRAAAVELLDRGLAHLVASDAHTPAIRGIGMAAATEAIGDARLAAWLTEEVPGAIVAGEPIPKRPPRARRPLLFRR